MRAISARTTIIGLLLIALLFASSVALAQNGFRVSRHAVANGGGQSAGGDYNLSGTIGQPHVGTSLTGGDYGLTGGFWFGLGVDAEIIVEPPADPPQQLYLPALQ